LIPLWRRFIKRENKNPAYEKQGDIQEESDVVETDVNSIPSSVMVSNRD
jgi:hypothetical protein